jgi:hypothetical protein
MPDGRRQRGWKGVDTAALRDILHAATAFGRVASAAKAIELGFAIEADDGPSGRLGHWRIAGMPVARRVLGGSWVRMEPYIGRTSVVRCLWR